jgi:hypothetical protein
MHIGVLASTRVQLTALIERMSTKIAGDEMVKQKYIHKRAATVQRPCSGVQRPSKGRRGAACNALCNRGLHAPHRPLFSWVVRCAFRCTESQTARRLKIATAPRAGTSASERRLR